MASFTEIMQQYVNLDYSDLLSTAKRSFAKIIPACEAVDQENKGFLMVTSIFLAALAADGKMSSKEAQFISDLLGLDLKQIEQFNSLYNSNMEELVDKFADSLNSNLKAEVITLCLCIASVDEKISREENAFLQKLLN